MGTHAMIEFKDEGESVYVFQHYDGFPEDIIPNIKKSLEFAWQLPRFEANEFGAAYIAANKPAGGGQIRIGNKENIWTCDYYDYYYIVNHTGEINVFDNCHSLIETHNLFKL